MRFSFSRAGRIHTLIVFGALIAAGQTVIGPVFAQHDQQRHEHLDHHHHDLVSVATAVKRRALLASFGNGPVMSRIQESIRNEIQDTKNNMEQQVATLVAKQVGDQVVRDMNNITTGTLNSMGFSDPEQLGEYIGSWAGWLVTVLTSAANTAIAGGEGGPGDVRAAEGTDAVAAGYVDAGRGVGSGAVEAVIGGVTEADLLRLQQVLEQLHALEHGQQPAAMSQPTVASGNGSANRTAVEEAVAQLLWRAFPANQRDVVGSNSTTRSGGGGIVTAPFRAVAAAGATPVVGPVRGLTGANELTPTATVLAITADPSSGGVSGVDLTTAAAAAALRTAIANHDAAAASDAVATLLDSLKGKASQLPNAINGDIGSSVISVIGGGSDQVNGVAPSTLLPTMAATQVDILPRPTRTAKQVHTAAASRTPRPQARDGPDVNVGRDLNVNVNVNVVPASATMPGIGGADGCKCTCPPLSGGGLASALASNLIGAFLPGKVRLVTGSGLMRSSDGSEDNGAVSMQQSAPQQEEAGTTGLGLRAAAAGATAGALLRARAGGVETNDTQSSARPLLRWRSMTDQRNGNTTSGANIKPSSSSKITDSTNTRSASNVFGATGVIDSPIASRISDTHNGVNSSGTGTGPTLKFGSGGGGGGGERARLWRAFTGSGRGHHRRQLRVPIVPAAAANTRSSNIIGVTSNESMDWSIRGHPRASNPTGSSGTGHSVLIIPHRQLQEGESVTSLDPWNAADAGNGDYSTTAVPDSILQSMELRGTSSSRPDDVYGTIYGTQSTTGATASQSSDQMLDLVRALINEVAGSDAVALNVGADSGDGDTDPVTTRQALPYIAAGADGFGSTAGKNNDKPTNANVNPIVLPSLQRSGPDIVRGTGGKATSCPPCKC